MSIYGTAVEGGILINNGLIEAVHPVHEGGTDRYGLTAERVIDAKSLTAVSGFIDTHSHNDIAVLTAPVVPPKLRQVITTEIVGQDGFSAAPVKNKLSQWGECLEPLYGGNLFLREDICSGTEAYLEFFMERGICANYGYLVPHGNFRFSCMTNPSHRASEYEVSVMADLFLLDESKIAKKASSSTPALHPEGIVEVFFNGQAVVSSGEGRDIRPGQKIANK